MFYTNIAIICYYVCILIWFFLLILDNLTQMKLVGCNFYIKLCSIISVIVFLTNLNFVYYIIIDVLTTTLYYIVYRDIFQFFDTLFKY